VIRFIAVRFVQLLGVLLAVSAIVFFALRLGPFDPTDQIAEAALGDPARIAELSDYWGLDEPLVVQYVKYLEGVVHGDLGKSLQDLQPVSVAIGDRLPATIELAVLSMLIGTALGIGMGVLAAYKRDTWADVGGRSAALVGISFPTFWLGVMAIAIFSVKLEWLPAGGRFSDELAFEPMTGFYVLDGVIQGRLDVVITALEHLVLPATVLGLLVAGLVTRVTRAAMIDALSKDYVRTALAKGATPRRVAIGHALGNALLPVTTIVGLMFGLLLSGAVIVETVFAFPGMGKLLVDSISVRDFPQIQACILVLAAIYSLVNATADVMYGVIDPRIRVT
jgi:ABC-type dipeptide/oligopeptide/nickel transport system permease component